MTRRIFSLDFRPLTSGSSMRMVILMQLAFETFHSSQAMRQTILYKKAKRPNQVNKPSTRRYFIYQPWRFIFTLPKKIVRTFFHFFYIFFTLEIVFFSDIVKFNFNTVFHDHILLTFRTEMFGFLHELITSYIKEKDIIKGKEDFIPVSKPDERTYDCIKWDLNPTLRLIPKFGSSVEPPGVDALLRSLGFHHALTTIPKWLQRGLMDNLNDLIYKLVKSYVKIIQDEEIFSNKSDNV